MVKVYVGQTKHFWFLHEDVLCYRSKYFKRVLNGRFKEAIEKSITLEEEDPVVFGLFVTWIYTQSLEGVKLPSSVDRKDRSMVWARLEVFAGKYGLPQMSIFATKNWRSCYPCQSGDKPSVDEVRFIYEQCPEYTDLRDEVARMLMCHYRRWDLDHYWLDEILNCHASAAEDFATALKESKRIYRCRG